ncbi:hypothetical protein ASPBRDRAFT_137843 [Aspergillus brasiliensis CBS 101740]|uniref:Uncharacterized protein n=1 Tax=Aspergillus brasiliensis (strain CBS 101740 / IMI 381727 / IBT 21946) TaxID=767769 RepID=A0A1L9U4I2_ASPBC|nr:hypothetical protein ASPBRDRAFT_137843 [Aspergillus brasiliensis CBS 101740]
MMQGVYHPRLWRHWGDDDAPRRSNPRYLPSSPQEHPWTWRNSTCGPSGAESTFNSMWDNADDTAIPVHFGIHVSNMRPIAEKENSLKPLPKPISEFSTDTEQW